MRCVQSVILSESPAVLFIRKRKSGHGMSDCARLARRYPVGLQPRRDTNVRRAQLTAPVDHMCQFSWPPEAFNLRGAWQVKLLFLFMDRIESN